MNKSPKSRALGISVISKGKILEKFADPKIDGQKQYRNSHMNRCSTARCCLPLRICCLAG